MKVDCWGLPPRGRRAAAGLALAAAGRPCRRRHAMRRRAGGGWRGGVGCRTFLNLLQTKVARLVPAAGFGPWLWHRMGRWPGPLRRRRGRLGLPHHGFLTAETASAGCRYGPSWLAERAVSRRRGVALAGCFGCARRETAVSQRVGSLARIWPSWLVGPPAGANAALSGQIILALIRHAKSRCVAVGMLF